MSKLRYDMILAKDAQISRTFHFIDGETQLE